MNQDEDGCCLACDDQQRLQDAGTALRLWETAARKLGWSEEVNEPPWSFVETVVLNMSRCLERIVAADVHVECGMIPGSPCSCVQAEAKTLRQAVRNLVGKPLSKEAAEMLKAGTEDVRAGRVRTIALDYLFGPVVSETAGATVSEICHATHVQNCTCCDDKTCGANPNVS